MNKKFSLKNNRVHHVNHAIINNTALENVSTSFSGFTTKLEKYRICINRCSYAIYYIHIKTYRPN